MSSSAWIEGAFCHCELLFQGKAISSQEGQIASSLEAFLGKTDVREITVFRIGLLYPVYEVLSHPFNVSCRELP